MDGLWAMGYGLRAANGRTPRPQSPRPKPRRPVAHAARSPKPRPTHEARSPAGPWPTQPEARSPKPAVRPRKSLVRFMKREPAPWADRIVSQRTSPP
jgi:hypothetical protein